MARPFIVISGLPASGKSTLARRLSQPLNLPVIDKDNILEALFESEGIGDVARRRTLSRESDEILQHEAAAALRGAILASFWRVPGMAADSGTPTSWVLTLSDQVLNVHCDCAPEVAAERFVLRQRHRGHLDETRSRDEVVASFRRLSALPHLDIPHRIHVDTSEEPTLDDVVRNVREILKALRP